MNQLLIAGCGDIASRAMPWLRQRYHVLALVRSAASAERWRALGAVPVPGDLDQPASLTRLAGLATDVLHAAPPPDRGPDDPRTRNLLAALAQGDRPIRRLVYISTTGVYGDCQGAEVDETRPVRAMTARAQRRVAAEFLLRAFARRQGAALRILRAPGIYAAERLSLERLRRGDPVLTADQDVFTNHIHADDLAHAACLALMRGPHCRVYNVCDDSHLRMGDWYDAIADAAGLARPPRASREVCARCLPAASLSFMGESRRLLNARVKRELRLMLAYPDARDGLHQIFNSSRKSSCSTCG